MTARLLVPAFVLLFVVGCGNSKITKANADLVKDGMTESEVAGILGAPNESQEVKTPDVAGALGGLGALGGMPGLGGGMPKIDLKAKQSVWKSGDKTIAITFVNGKVAMKATTGF
ncbi:MAG: hypothetical protein K2W96_02750 [Gemmataceae bacterium]|nr:hypothetical protein [Gemmataceae bacterium]